MFSQSISINHNHLQLSGVLHLPKRKQHEKVPLIVLLHGFIGSKVGEHRLFVKAARYFTKKDLECSVLILAVVGKVMEIMPM